MTDKVNNKCNANQTLVLHFFSKYIRYQKKLQV